MKVIRGCSRTTSSGRRLPALVAYVLVEHLVSAHRRRKRSSSLSATSASTARRCTRWTSKRGRRPGPGRFRVPILVERGIRSGSRLRRQFRRRPAGVLRGGREHDLGQAAARPVCVLLGAGGVERSRLPGRRPGPWAARSTRWLGTGAVLPGRDLSRTATTARLRSRRRASSSPMQVPRCTPSDARRRPDLALRQRLRGRRRQDSGFRSGHRGRSGRGPLVHAGFRRVVRLQRAIRHDRRHVRLRHGTCVRERDRLFLYNGALEARDAVSGLLSWSFTGDGELSPRLRSSSRIRLGRTSTRGRRPGCSTR